MDVDDRERDWEVRRELDVVVVVVNQNGVSFSWGLGDRRRRL